MKRTLESPLSSLSEELLDDVFSTLPDETLTSIIDLLSGYKLNHFKSLIFLNKRFYRLATSNNVWIKQFHLTLLGRYDKYKSYIKKSAQTFIHWLDAIIKSNVIDYHLVCIPQDNIDISREYILFRTSASLEARNNYTRFPNVVEARFSLGPLARALYEKSADNSEEIVIPHNRITDQNKICCIIADMINNAFKSMTEAIMCSQEVTKKSEQQSQYKLLSMFPQFSGSNLWFTLFKMCVLEGRWARNYRASNESARHIWNELDSAMITEIQCIPALNSYYSGSVNKPPTAWTRPDAIDLSQTPNWPICFTCKDYVPKRMDSVISVIKALLAIGPLKLKKNIQFCSSVCLLNAIKNKPNELMIPCHNPTCSSELTLRHAFGYFTDNSQTLPQRMLLQGLTLDIRSVIELDVMSKELRTDFVEKFFMVHSLCNHYKALSTSPFMNSSIHFDTPHGDADDENGGVVVMNLDNVPRVPLDSKNDTTLVTLIPSAVGAEMDQPRARLPRFRYYLEELPETACSIESGDADHISTKAWENRINTYQRFRNKLPGAFIPWSFVGARLPAVDLFFPMPYVVHKERQMKDTVGHDITVPCYQPYCSMSCMHHHTDGLRTIPSVTHCLNRYCHRTFNLTDAALTLECFELVYKDKHCGYLCDYYCRDAYLFQRADQLKAMKSHIINQQQYATEGSPSKRVRLDTITS